MKRKTARSDEKVSGKNGICHSGTEDTEEKKGKRIEGASEYKLNLLLEARPATIYCQNCKNC